MAQSLTLGSDTVLVIEFSQSPVEDLELVLLLEDGLGVDPWQVLRHEVVPQVPPRLHRAVVLLAEPFRYADRAVQQSGTLTRALKDDAVKILDRLELIAQIIV